MLWPSLVNDTERLFCWLFLAYQIDKIILSVLCCSLNENRMWSHCILKTLAVKLPCANVMNFTQLTQGGSPTKRWAPKAFLFISWKEFWNMSEDLCPKPGIVHGLCLLWLLRWWRAQLQQPHSVVNTPWTFGGKLGYLGSTVKAGFILLKVHLKLQSEV